MPDSVSYWICKCGAAIHGDARQCTACSRRRPRRWLWAVLGVIGVGAASLLFGQRTSEPFLSAVAPDQAQFIKVIADANAAWRAAPNEVAANEVLQRRDRTLAEIAGGDRIERWRGQVQGVSPMTEGAGFSVTIEGAELLAGVHLSRGLDTVIRPKDEIYKSILTLSPGDSVIFSGEFETFNDSLSDLSYVSNNAANKPSYLFRFTKLERLE